MVAASDSGQPADPGRLGVLLRSLEAYRSARMRLLETLGLAVSNRDPLAEFSEHLVHALLGGQLAESRIQKGYDLIAPSGERVQVRYLANPGSARWVNEHHVRCGPDCDRYALVLYESFTPAGVLVFPQALTAIGAALGKSHPEQETNLQLTRANYLMVRQHPDQFREMGMQVWPAPFTQGMPG
ncbi:MAG TPA: hypothetical protein VGG75_19650 [Trebonia sp.]|jgi:hypothetical protein